MNLQIFVTVTMIIFVGTILKKLYDKKLEVLLSLEVIEDRQTFIPIYKVSELIKSFLYMEFILIIQSQVDDSVRCPLSMKDTRQKDEKLLICAGCLGSMLNIAL